MADSVKKQQGKTGKPGRPKGSTTKKRDSRKQQGKKTEHGICREEQFFQKGTGTGL